VTQSIASAAMATASVPVIRAMLDYALSKDYTAGVLGIRASPDLESAGSFIHKGKQVKVVPCVSALAVREALLDRALDSWLVVLTDRADEDLGSGILSHFLWHRLRTPDPWEAVRLRFAATGIDPALTSLPGNRDIANGLLTAAPISGWPPAPGGVLTRDHALGAVARAHLGLNGEQLDAFSALEWSTDAGTVGRIADLRGQVGDALSDAVLDWVADGAGVIAGALRRLLRQGEGSDALPLGIVAGLLADAIGRTADDDAQVARMALVRLEQRWGSPPPNAAILRSWGLTSTSVFERLLATSASQPIADRLLTRADEIVQSAQAGRLTGLSQLLPAGLTARIQILADAMRELGSRAPARADVPVAARDSAVIDQQWSDVVMHSLARRDLRVPAFRGAVRLVRWLGIPDVEGRRSLLDLAHRQADVDAWVDAAVNDAAPGVDDPDLGAGLAAVLGMVQRRRDAHDVEFAAALADQTSRDAGASAGRVEGEGDPVWHLERVMPNVVFPLARQAPVLLLVLDGMSTGVATELVGDVLGRAAEGWAEALLPNHERRGSAVSVLPSLTEVSRASLLSGELCTGQQDTERRGYDALVTAHGLTGAALFHKKPLDSSRLGFSIADDVATAIDDVSGRPLVTCVLNTIDDALDRSDPAGTDWGAETVKHLTPLLNRARHSGRIVVMTADHGHVVERRQGTQRSFPDISSGRSRAASPGHPAGEGEILIAGRRVLKHGGTAILPVSERLRYGPLKAGYHGGASPAEVVVPLVILVPGSVPNGVSLQLAPPQEPQWWSVPVMAGETTQWPTEHVIGMPNKATFRAGSADKPPTLFDDLSAKPTQPQADSLPSDGPRRLARALVASTAYTSQRKIAGRVATTDGQVEALVFALLLAPDHRLAQAQAAVVLSEPLMRMRGAVVQVQQLLNVEGYPVLRLDVDGSTLVLDEALLREQFEVRA
jgi:hypothetical protein